MNNNPAPGMQGVSPTGASGPTIYVVTQSQKPPEHILPRKAVIVLASLQIVAAVIAFISQIVLIFADNVYGLGFLGTGIWCGVFFSISGSLGILAAVGPSKCRIVALLVMSVLSACLCLPMIAISSYGVGESNRAGYYCGPGSSFYCKNPDEEVQKAMNIIQILISLTVAVLAITLSAFSCRAVCCQQTNQMNRINHPGMVAVAPGIGALSAGVPVQYMQQTPMPNQAHPVIQYNGLVASAPGTTYYTVPLQAVQGGGSLQSNVG